jgi:acyl-CoA reductase-like NAD-dependent aldehyde dehydrogenase
VLESLRRGIASDPEPLLRALRNGARASDGESLASEIIPLVDALRFLENEASELLDSRRLGRRGRPAWLRGVTLEVVREPHGKVLVVGPSNYPLFLPGVQVVQALCAGNEVLWKPGEGGTPSARALSAMLERAGLPGGTLRVLPEDPQAALDAIDTEADFVVLTGSIGTARTVLARCALRPVPAVVEASGCDAVFVLPDADLRMVADCLAFAARWNGGATCIAPRRVFVLEDRQHALEALLVERMSSAESVVVHPRSSAMAVECALEALAEGARLVHGELRPGSRMRPVVVAGAKPEMRIVREDLFAPFLALVPVSTMEDALAFDTRCPYSLGASVFGEETEARSLAGRIRCGTVTINDLIVPTADPRVSFGGRDSSGYGKTRGPEGLISMTVSKTILVRGGRFRPHLRPLGPAEESLFRAWLECAHGRGLFRRFRGGLRMARGILSAAGRSYGKEKKS